MRLATNFSHSLFKLADKWAFGRNPPGFDALSEILRLIAAEQGFVYGNHWPNAERLIGPPASRTNRVSRGTFLLNGKGELTRTTHHLGVNVRKGARVLRFLRN